MKKHTWAAIIYLFIWKSYGQLHKKWSSQVKLWKWEEKHIIYIAFNVFFFSKFLHFI